MDKQAYMFELVEEWEVSGLSKKAFRRNHGIATNKFFTGSKNGRTANRKFRMDL